MGIEDVHLGYNFEVGIQIFFFEKVVIIFSKMKQPIQLMVLEELRITNYRVNVEGDLIMIVEVRSRRSKNFELEK